MGSDLRRPGKLAEMPIETVRARRAIYARTYPLVLSLAVFAAIGGFLFLFVPHIIEETALGEILPGRTEMAWCALYGMGGLLILLGYWLLNSKLEVAGLLLLAMCYLIYGYSVFELRGAAPGVVSASIFAGLCVGCTGRALALSKAR